MKYSIMLITFFIAVLCMTHILVVQNSDCPAHVPAQFSHVKPGAIVAGYIAGSDKYSGFKIEALESVANKLTHIFYAFATPDAQKATCTLQDPWADVGANFQHRKKVGGNFGQLLALKQKFPHLKIILSVGGGKNSAALLDIAMQGNIESFVQSLLQLLHQYRYSFKHSDTSNDHEHLFVYPDLFDGVDLDWEWPGCKATPEQVALYHNMVHVIAKNLKRHGAVHNKKYIFTCAVQANCKLIENFHFEKLVDDVDWFNLMAYDFGGASARGVSMNAPICNPQSEYSVDSAVHALMLAGISPQKMVLGIPLYGHIYDQAQEKLGSAFAKTAVTRALSYAHIKNLYIDDPACKKKWHKKSHVPYLYCPDDSVFVSYDDVDSVRFKIKYAKEKRLQGVFFWKLSGDDSDGTILNSIP